jgi:hypothetical protein
LIVAFLLFIVGPRFAAGIIIEFQ